MNANTAAAIILPAINKNDEITVTLTDGTTVTGRFISVNSKGVNINVDGKTVSRGLARVADVTLVANPDINTVADMFPEGITYGAAAIAAALEMSAYDLRVILRDLGYGVGKGRVYTFDAGDARVVYRTVRAMPAPDATV